MAKHAKGFDFPQLRISVGKRSAEGGNRGEGRFPSSADNPKLLLDVIQREREFYPCPELERASALMEEHAQAINGHAARLLAHLQ